MDKVKLKKYVKIRSLKCPNCGHIHESLVLTDGIHLKCSKCHFKARPEEYEIVERKVLAFLCLNCREYVPNIWENRNLIGVFNEILCPKCLSVVGINGKHIVEHERITEQDLAKCEMLDTNLYVFEAKTRRQKILVRILNVKAQKEPISSFRTVPRLRDHSSQYVLVTRNKPVGYLSFIPKWKMDKPLMNQLYVIPEVRRRGYATKLVQYFIDKNVDKTSDFWFIVESPNEKSYNLFKKMGIAGKIRCVNLG